MVATVTLLLSGCTGVSHVSATLINGVPAFAFCEPLVINDIAANAAPTSEVWNANVPIWEVSGQSGVVRDTVVILGVAPDGFTTIKALTPIDAKSFNIQISFENSDQSLPNQNARFNGNDLVEGKCLDWNSQLVDTPCANE